MPEQLVAVTNPEPSNRPLVVSGTLTTNPSGTQDVNVVGPTPIYVAPLSSLSSAYLFSVANLPGVVAANNFISIFNPSGSGKTIFLSGSFVSAVAGAATSATAPLRGYRITTATGGSLQANSTVAKFKTSQADPVAEIRIGNPTVTLGPAIFNVPPAITASGGSGGFISDVEPPPNSPTFSLAENEGVVFRTESGDTDQIWNITVAWVEA